MMLKARQCSSLRTAARGRTSSVQCLAFKEATGSKLVVPDWAAPATPVLEFFNSTSYDAASVKQLLSPITSSEAYITYAKDFVEGPVAKESFGWKPIPEAINGRAAMIGFVVAALGEIFNGRSFLQQLSGAPQITALVILLIIVGSIVPIVKGTKGEYLDSLFDTYSLPAGWFTEANERVHGRLAMVGIAGLLVAEIVTAHALL